MQYTTASVFEPDHWPLTLADLKVWCRVTANYEDAILLALRAAAIETIDRQADVRLRVERGFMDIPLCGNGAVAWTLPWPLRGILGAQIETANGWQPLALEQLSGLVPDWEPVTRIAARSISSMGFAGRRVRIEVVVGYGEWMVPKVGFPYAFPIVFGQDRLPINNMHPVLERSSASGNEVTTMPVPEFALQAARMLVGHWFENREAVVTGTITAELPLGVERLVHLLRPSHYG